MGLFGKKKKFELLAVADGKAFPLSEVEDEVFSSGMMGRGVAIRPTGNIVVAPAAGTVTVAMKESGHALNLALKNGMNLLIHVGIDTVKLKGHGFHCYVGAGEEVETGAKLIRFDKEEIENAGLKPDIMEIVLDDEASAKHPLIFRENISVKAGITVIAEEAD